MRSYPELCIEDKVDALFSPEELFIRKTTQPLRKIPILPPILSVPPTAEEPQQSTQSLASRRECEDTAISPRTLWGDVSVETQVHNNRKAEEAIPKDGIPRNRQGERIDPHVNFCLTARNSIAKREPRVCNVHHLRGNCPFGRACAYSHDPLGEKEIKALRRLAREQPCRKGSQCEDPTCFAGHHCPRLGKCKPTCRFGPRAHISGWDMHVYDREIVNAGSNGLCRTSTVTTGTEEEPQRFLDKGKQRAGKPKAAQLQQSSGASHKR